MIIIVEKLCCGSVKVGSRGQVVLPIDLRKKFGIKAGDVLFVCAKGCCIELMKTDVLKKALEKVTK